MKKMTKKDSQLFSSLMFYWMSIVFACFVLALPVMLYFSYQPFTIFLLFVITFALSNIVMVILQRCYWLFSSTVTLLFKKFSLPLIGQEQSSKMICDLQEKVFIFLQTLSAFVVVCYGILKLVSISSLTFFSSFFQLLLVFACWTIIILMAIDGIFTYLVCLFEIVLRLIGYKRPKRLLKVSWDAKLDDLMDFTEEKNYIPKRLALMEPSVSEKTFSLKPSVMEANTRINKKHLNTKKSITKPFGIFQ